MDYGVYFVNPGICLAVFHSEGLAGTHVEVSKIGNKSGCRVTRPGSRADTAEKLVVYCKRPSYALQTGSRD